MRLQKGIMEMIFWIYLVANIKSPGEFILHYSCSKRERWNICCTTTSEKLVLCKNWWFSKPHPRLIFQAYTFFLIVHGTPRYLKFHKLYWKVEMFTRDTPRETTIIVENIGWVMWPCAIEDKNSLHSFPRKKQMKGN